MKLAILRALSVVYPDHAETDIIASMLRMDEKLVSPYLAKMTDSHNLYGPLVNFYADGWGIAGYNQDAEDKLTAEQIEKVLKENAMWRTESSGGWGYLWEAITNPRILETDTKTWKEEATTGIKVSGKRSKIIDAVIPDDEEIHFNGYRDPESKAEITNMQYLGITFEQRRKEKKVRSKLLT